MQIRPPNSTPPDIVFTGLLAAVAAVSLCSGYILRRTKLNRKKDTLDGVLRNYRVALVLGLGFFEAITLYGFILYFMGAAGWVFAVFVAVALVAMVSIRPTRQALAEYVATHLLSDEDQP